MRTLRSVAGFGVIAAGLTMGLAAQPPAKPFKAPPTQFECRWTAEPIEIDGKGDEAAWRQAQVIDVFHQPWLGDKAVWAKTATRARLLWNEEHLFFFADLEDHDLFADITEHDGKAWLNDVFELFFKPEASKPAYYEFQVNAAGTVLDMFIPKRAPDAFERFIKADKFNLQAKVQRRGTLNQHNDRDQGWSVEGRIPWTDFRPTSGRPAAGADWKFALCRYDYSQGAKPELSTVAPLKSHPYPDFHAHEDYATLRFVGPK